VVGVCEQMHRADMGWPDHSELYCKPVEEPAPTGTTDQSVTFAATPEELAPADTTGLTVGARVLFVAPVPGMSPTCPTVGGQPVELTLLHAWTSARAGVVTALAGSVVTVRVTVGSLTDGNLLLVEAPRMYVRQTVTATVSRELSMDSASTHS